MDLHQPPKTFGDVEEIRRVVSKQLAQIKANNTWVDCGTCESSYPLWKLYRCYYCGVWICENCAPHHFGKKRELMAVAPAASGVRCG
jgi:hypothetical protein